jgi:hypothetical protein
VMAVFVAVGLNTHHHRVGRLRGLRRRRDG